MGLHVRHGSGAEARAAWSLANLMNICMFSNLFPPLSGGSATHCWELSRRLAAAGHRVSVITARVEPGSHSHEVSQGVEIFRLPALGLPRLPIAFNFPWLHTTFTPANLARVGRILDRLDPQVIHLHNHMFDLAFPAVLWARRRHIPLVLTIHSIIRHPKAAYNLILYPLDRILLKHAVVRRADAVIGPTLNATEYMSGVFGRVDVRLIRYGMDMPEPPSPETCQGLIDKYGLTGKRVILSLGHVNPMRHRLDLVEAMPEVLESFPQAILLVVGLLSNPETVRLVKRLGLEQKVIFTGPVAHDQVPALFEIAELEAHWVIRGNLEEASLGLASLEAMASGKVVLGAPRMDSYGQGVLVDNGNFIMVKPVNPHDIAQKIMRVLGDKAAQRRIGQRARQTIERYFSWERVIGEITGLYRELLASGSYSPKI